MAVLITCCLCGYQIISNNATVAHSHAAFHYQSSHSKRHPAMIIINPLRPNNGPEMEESMDFEYYKAKKYNIFIQSSISDYQYNILKQLNNHKKLPALIL